MLRSEQHPAFIENYTTAHTDILKTMPNGTYVIFPVHDRPCNEYMVAVASEGRVKGFTYRQMGDDLIFTGRSSFSLSHEKISIFDVVGDGMTIMKAVLDPSIQLTKTLTSCLLENPAASKIIKDKIEAIENAKREAVRRYEALLSATKSIIVALERDIESGQHCVEDNDEMTMAIKAIKDTGDNVDVCLEIIEQAKRSFRRPTTPLKYTNDALLTHGLIKDVAKESSSVWTNLFSQERSLDMSQASSASAQLGKAFK